MISQFLYLHVINEIHINFIYNKKGEMYMEQYVASILGDAKLEQFLSQETDVKFKNQFILMYNYLNKVTNNFKNLDIISQEAETFEKFNKFLSAAKLQNGDLTADDRDAMLNILQKCKNYIDSALEGGIEIEEDLCYELEYFDYTIEEFERESMEVMDIPYIIEQMSKNEELISEVAKMFDMTSPDNKFAEVIYYLTEKYDKTYGKDSDFTTENLEKMSNGERAKIQQELLVFKAFNEKLLERANEMYEYHSNLHSDLVYGVYDPDSIDEEHYCAHADYHLDFNELYREHCIEMYEHEFEPDEFEDFITNLDPFRLCQFKGDSVYAEERMNTANRILNDINGIEKVTR